MDRWGYGWMLLAALVSGCGDGGRQRINGLLEWDRIELTVERNEPIVEILVEEGQRVTLGQTILQQDDRRVTQELAEAEGALREALARLAEALRGPRSERISAARARLRAVQAELGQADRDSRRQQTLLRQRLASEAVAEQAASRAQALGATVAEARALLEELAAGSTEEELSQLRALVMQAEARVAGLRISRERLQVQAPQAAWVDEILFAVGERPPTGRVVAVLLGGSAPYARVFVPEPLRASVYPGLEVTVEVDGVAEPLRGLVRWTSQEAAFTPFFSLTERDRSRLSYAAEIDLLGAEAAHLPGGLPVQVVLPSEQVQAAIKGSRYGG